MNRFTATTTGSLAVAAIVGLAACGSGSSKAEPARVQVVAAPASATTTGPTIAVAGHGTVEGKPDTATVTMGVQTSGPSAQAAMQQNNNEAAALIAALKAKGVADNDMQTTDLSISPNWDTHGHVTGYSVSNTVTVTLHGIDNAGAIIDDAAAKVGNDVRLEGVALSIANTSKYMAQARASAVTDALTQATQLADAAHVKLGPIRTIDDTASQSPQPLYFNGQRALADAGLGATPTPVEAGQQQLTFDVNVVFGISS
jgi:hypothetical protein